MPEKTSNPNPGKSGTELLPAPADPITRKAPLYHVILHDDDMHSYHYVIAMLMQLFGKTHEQAYKHACEVDSTGVTIVDTTTLERAELKRDQIRAYGRDPLIAQSSGSMSASIEPAE